MIAPLIVWWAGLWLWRQVADCENLDPTLAVPLTLSSVVAVVAVGAVPWLPLRSEAGSRWLLRLAVVLSAVVLVLSGVAMAVAVTFALGGGSSRAGEVIASAVLSLVLSLALAGASGVGLLPRLSTKRRLAAAAVWAGVVSAAALIAYAVMRSAC